jgi:hypothetical protein
VRPIIIYWNLGAVVLTSVFGSLAVMAMSRDHDGCMANHLVARHYIPYGATGWRTLPSDAWRPLAELPKEWNLK